MVKVLIVEDSPVIRELLTYILGSDEDIEVIGTVANGEDAIEAVSRRNPDVITMDIHMPGMNGIDATRRIMETHPAPIVIVSGSSNSNEAETAFEAIGAGALAVIERPRGIGHPEHATTSAKLIQMVKLMSEVKVVRRWPQATRRGARSNPPVAADSSLKSQPGIRLLAIGASTGGPLALQTILSRLPQTFPLPVLIVQHIAPGFVVGLAEWLARTCALPVHVAAHGEVLLTGHVYLAPDDLQMKVGKTGATIQLTGDEAEHGLRPAVSCMFRSVVDVYGARAVGVLLTGMGKDGADELCRMREKGAITFAQDEVSSVVHGMPGEAIRLDGASYVLSPEKIADALISLVNGRKRG